MVYEPPGSLPGTLSMRVFDAPAKLAQAVAAAVQEAVLTAVRARGRASLVVASGSLPAGCAPLLAAFDLPWERVQLTLADEMRLPTGDERSHARWLTDSLPPEAVSAASFVPLLDPADADPLAGASERLRAMALPFDLVLLGIDPQGQLVAPAPAADGAAPVRHDPAAPLCCWVEPPAGSEPAVPRLSLTLAALLDSRRILIVARGNERREAFERTLLGHGPASSALQALALRADQPIDFCWSR